MKKMWARIGVSVEMTEEEYNKFISNSRGDAAERSQAEDWLKEKLESRKGVELSGESYFLDKEYLKGMGYANVEEISFLF